MGISQEQDATIREELFPELGRSVVLDWVAPFDLGQIPPLPARIPTALAFSNFSRKKN